MAQNIIYSPWERTKDRWLSLMTTLLLFGLLWLFSFVSAFLTSLMKLILGLKFSIDKRQAEDVVGGGARTIVSCSFAIGQVLAHAQLLGTLKNYSRLLQQSQEFERWLRAGVGLNEKFISYTRPLLQDWERGGCFIYSLETNTENQAKWRNRETCSKWLNR